jgi:hypothetical protein
MVDVFISYSSKDQKIADAVVNYFESSKVKCWIAYRDADAGTLYSASIMKAIKNSSIFVLVFSENSNKSHHVLKEIDAACRYEKIIIPFKIDACQPDDAVEYYLSATHWLDAISAPMDNHLNDLVKTVNRYLEKKVDVSLPVGSEAVQPVPVVSSSSKDKTKAHLILLSGMDVTEKDLREALLLDRIVYDGIEGGQFNIEKGLAWHKINPDIYFVLRDAELDALVGYMNIAPVTESCYNKIATGNILDMFIDEDSILPYDLPGLYHLNFTSIVVNPLYRSSGVILQFMNAVVSKMIDLSKQEIYFKAMIADAVTPAGEKLCRMFGMELITESNHDSKIYAVSLVPPKFRKSSKSLITLSEIYEKLNDGDMTSF